MTATLLASTIPEDHLAASRTALERELSDLKLARTEAILAGGTAEDERSARISSLEAALLALDDAAATALSQDREATARAWRKHRHAIYERLSAAEMARLAKVSECEGHARAFVASLLAIQNTTDEVGKLALELIGKQSYRLTADGVTNRIVDLFLLALWAMKDKPTLKVGRIDTTRRTPVDPPASWLEAERHAVRFDFIEIKGKLDA